MPKIKWVTNLHEELLNLRGAVGQRENGDYILQGENMASPHRIIMPSLRVGSFRNTGDWPYAIETGDWHYAIETDKGIIKFIDQDGNIIRGQEPMVGETITSDAYRRAIDDMRRVGEPQSEIEAFMKVWYPRISDKQENKEKSFQAVEENVGRLNKRIKENLNFGSIS